MYQFTGFSEKANLALNNAVSCAEDMGHTYIGSEHILAGLLKDPSGVASVILRSAHVTYDGFYEKIRVSVGVGIPTELSVDDMTPRCRKIIETSLALSASEHSALTGTEHLLSAVLRDNKCVGTRLLVLMGVSPSSLLGEIAGANGAAGEKNPRSDPETNGPGRRGEHSALAKYGTDLTAEAAAGRIDPVSGRKKEIDRVIRILCRRTKNNPCLIGEPGVGKTAVAEGLALRIASGDVPDALKGTSLRTLELTGMVAGAKYRGDFEERIRSVIREVKETGSVILFIDEIHNLIGAGSAEGAVDAANILKPVLARGEIRLIGATTFEEYRRSIEKDAALERRFQTVPVDEPTAEQTLTILEELRPRYEAHHRVKIDDGALKAAVELSSRYLADRFLPDKAIDLMDEAASGVSLRSGAFPPCVERLREESGRLNREKANAVSARDFEGAARIRDREKAVNKRLAAASAEWSRRRDNTEEVTAEDIARVVSERTGIPAESLNEEEKSRLLSLEKRLEETVFGQTDAIKTVAAAVRRGRSGIGDPSRPVGSFLFCGPTGVGKTALAKALARDLFGDSDALIRLDMTEFSEKHTVSSLIGAPPGYVGYEEGGKLIERIRRRPYSVILFDELEKAHPDVFNALLQILDEGVLTSSDGRKADCRHAIIIMTSNVGARLIASGGASLGFAANGKKTDENALKKAVEGELKTVFRPEFLNRVDEIVLFGRLPAEAVVKIASTVLEGISERARALGTPVEFGGGVSEWLAEKGYDEEHGVRRLKRLIVTEIEDPLSEYLIRSSAAGTEKIVFTVKNGTLCREVFSAPVLPSGKPLKPARIE